MCRISASLVRSCCYGIDLRFNVLHTEENTTRVPCSRSAETPRGHSVVAAMCILSEKRPAERFDQSDRRGSGRMCWCCQALPSITLLQREHVMYDTSDICRSRVHAPRLPNTAREQTRVSVQRHSSLLAVDIKNECSHQGRVYRALECLSG